MLRYQDQSCLALIAELEFVDQLSCELEKKASDQDHKDQLTGSIEVKIKFRYAHEIELAFYFQIIAVN